MRPDTTVRRLSERVAAAMNEKTASCTALRIAALIAGGVSRSRP